MSDDYLFDCANAEYLDDLSNAELLQLAATRAQEV